MHAKDDKIGKDLSISCNVLLLSSRCLNIFVVHNGCRKWFWLHKAFPDIAKNSVLKSR
jgi:hypothetical protein